MKESAVNWTHKAIAAVITGGSTAVLATIGVAGADAIGAGIKPLDFKQLGVLFVSGALVGLLAYLKQSPIPPAEVPK